MNLKLDKVSRESLCDQTAGRVRSLIHTNQLLPGDCLPSTAELVDLLGVSRPIVREAMKVLAGENRIVISNGRRPFVKPIESSDLHTFFDRAAVMEKSSLVDLLELRRGIEIEAARLAASRRTVEQLSDIERSLLAMSREVGRGPAFSQLDVAFHQAIAIASGNAMIARMVCSIRGAIATAISVWHNGKRTSAEYAEVQALHQAIFQQIKKGDPQNAGLEMEKHFDVAISEIASGSDETSSVSSKTPR